VAAATHDTEKQLAWEARHRPRAAIAAFLSAAGLLVFYVTQQILQRDVPKSSGLQSLERIAQPGSIGTLPSLQTPFFEYLDSKTPLLAVIALGGFVGFFGIAWTVGFLGVATRARQPTLRRWALYLPIVGGAVIGISVLMSQIGSVTLVDDYLTGPKTVNAARDNENSLLLLARLLFQIGTLTLAVGLVLVSLNALRAGLLTKLFGYVGIIAGGLLLLVPLPVVQIFWVGGLGVLYLGRWPGGDLPAWRTGNAEPWPSARSVPPAQRRPATTRATSAAERRRKRKKRH
jgi:hypothetical protein